MYHYNGPEYKEAYQGTKEGLDQMTDEQLQRILDYEGDMIGDGSIMLDDVG